MDQKQIDRINALARKSRSVGLTEEERAEQAVLRRAYIDAVTGSLRAHLDQTYIVDEQGHKRKLGKKE